MFVVTKCLDRRCIQEVDAKVFSTLEEAVEYLKRVEWRGRIWDDGRVVAVKRGSEVLLLS